MSKNPWAVESIDGRQVGVALRDGTRIDDCQPKLILSASCGIEVARVVPYKPLLDAAIELAQAKPEACLIVACDDVIDPWLVNDRICAVA